jgi:hypothetical protein
MREYFFLQNVPSGVISVTESCPNCPILYVFCFFALARIL